MPKSINSSDESKYFFKEFSSKTQVQGEDSKYFSGVAKTYGQRSNESKYFLQTKTKTTKEYFQKDEKISSGISGTISSADNTNSKEAKLTKLEKLLAPIDVEEKVDIENDDIDIKKLNRTLLAKQREIADAEKKAEKILAAAEKHALAVHKQLEEEIAEAEAKRRQLSKTIVEDTVAQANEKARTLIEEANKKADEVLKNAVKKGYEKGFEEGTQKGYEKGTQKGYEKGHLDGVEAGNREIAEKISLTTQQAKEIIVAAEEKSAEIIESSKDKMVKIVMAVASKVINQELEENPYGILQIVKEASQKVADQPRIFITVSPTNYELVNSAQSELKKLLGTKQEVTVLADNSFGTADVVVSTGGSGSVDARLDTQLNEIRKAIELVISND